MKLPSILSLVGAASLLSVATTQAQTLAGYSFQAGLTTLTDISGIEARLSDPSQKAAAVAYMTDNSLNTGVFNTLYPSGNLAGTFGDSSYTHGTGADILIVGVEGGGTPLWENFNVQLLLSDGSYTPAKAFGNANVVNTGTSGLFDMYQTQGDYLTGLEYNYCYVPLDISTFNTGGLGVTGIKLSSVSAGSADPDLTYIGVTGLANVTPAPEPATLALAGLGLSALLLRKRK